LAGLPICLGTLSAELVYGAWLKLVFTHGEVARPVWLGVLLGSSVVSYLAILWGLARHRMMRMIALGLAGTGSIGVAFLPGFGAYLPSRWLSESRLIPLVAGVALATAIAAWLTVARQRTGGGGSRNFLVNLTDPAVDLLPRRRRDFASAAGAQFWFEWRRCGLLLPLCVSTALVLIIAPISWLLRNDHAATLWILGWTLAMPMLLALPIGKGFSKADFWSRDLSLPPFIAVRPLATGDLVVNKMKVAAVSAAISWWVVLMFLSLWLPLWADTSDLSMVRVGFWMVYDHSVAPQYAIVALLGMAGALVTWKFLVGGLWIGLSGSKRLFVGSGAAYGSALILGVIGLALLNRYAETHRDGPPLDGNQLLVFLQWILAVAVIAKFWLAAFSWRYVARARVWRYLVAWTAGAMALIALAILIWADGALAALLQFFPMDAIRLKHFLILVALLLIPFARLGYAPLSLARNRHGKP
jgi:hypothetical protein